MDFRGNFQICVQCLYVYVVTQENQEFDRLHQVDFFTAAVKPECLHFVISLGKLQYYSAVLRISCLAFIMGTNLSSTHIHQFARQHYWSRWTDLQEERTSLAKIHHFLLMLDDDQQQAFCKITAYLDITVIQN